MALFSPPPSSKTYSEHKTHTTIFTPPLHHTKLPKTIRIHVADPDATDSSGDENDTSFPKPRKIRKYINEITIQSSYLAKNNTTHVENSVKTSLPAVENACRKRQKAAGKSRTAKKMRNSGRKYRGVRQRPWGTWAAEINCGVTRGRLWLGTYKTAEEAAMVYDHAAVVLRGPHALSNFGTEKSNHEDSESMQCLVREVGYKERFPGSNDAFCEKDPFNDPVMSVLDPMDFSMFDFEKECRTMFSGSVSDIGSTSWPTRDYFQELGDVFGSDLLVSMN